MRSSQLAYMVLIIVGTLSACVVQAGEAADPRENAALQYWLAFDVLQSSTRFGHEVDAATSDDPEFGFEVPVGQELKSHLQGAVEIALRHLHRAAELPYCEWGIDLRKDGLLTSREAPYGENAHRLARYSLLRARWRFEHEDWDGGIDDVIATMMMGRHIGRDKIAFNIHYGCQIEGMCVGTAAVYLTRMPDTVQQRLSNKLASLPRATAMREVVLHYEDAVDWAVDRFKHANGDELSKLLTVLLSPDEAQAILQRAGDANGVVDLALETRILRPEYVGLLSLAPDDFVREFNARIQPQIDANPLLAELGPFYPEMRHEECTAQCRLAMLKAGIAVIQKGKAALSEHPDPFGDGNFEYTAFEGGFKLRSDLIYGEAGQIELDFGVCRN